MAIPTTYKRATTRKPAEIGQIALRAVFYAIVAILLVYTIFPFYWAFNTSITPSNELFGETVNYWPKNPTFDNYVAVFTKQNFARNLWNSLVVAGLTVLASLAIGSLAAYALGRFRFKGKTIVLYMVLGVSMFPQIAVLPGLFSLIRSIGIYNTYGAMIFSYLIFTLPFTIWVLTSFVREIPGELEEAALVDGANTVQTLWHVLLPVMGPGLFTTGLLAFINAWNEYLFALTFTLGDKVATVPVAISRFGGSSSYESPWPNIMAGSVVVTIPLIILVLIFQRRIVAGLTAGAVKG
jgi:trehalose/maltose transport system permease protein